METPKQGPVLKCDFCERYPRLEGTNKCESCYSVVRHFLEQDSRFKDILLPDLRKKEETLEERIKGINVDTGFRLVQQETLEEITEQIQNECHSFVESVPNVNYQDATNTFLFMKLAELTLKLKNYETRS